MPCRPRALRIYECHVGMSSVEPKVNSYLEFRRDMLPRIRKVGRRAGGGCAPLSRQEHVPRPPRCPPCSRSVASHAPERLPCGWVPVLVHPGLCPTQGLFTLRMRQPSTCHAPTCARHALGRPS